MQQVMEVLVVMLLILLMVVMVVLVEQTLVLVVMVVDKMFRDRHLLQTLLAEELPNMLEVQVD